MQTPVVFFIFNRPDSCQTVFEQIRNARPPKLYVVCDGPRPDRPDDRIKLQESQAILQKVDWDCQVSTNFAEQNLGCGKRISSGIDWVFSLEERAIFLEDDCVPDPSFFPYCEELLERYQDHPAIGMITGFNRHFGLKFGKASYFFSRCFSVWGWASWRRAWQGYDLLMRTWPEEKNQPAFRSLPYAKHAAKKLEETYQGKIDTWDYQWFFFNTIRHRLSVVPNVNLIQNIGYEGVHYTGRRPSILQRRTKTAIEFPLIHPNEIKQNLLADRIDNIISHYQPQQLLPQPIKRVLKKLLLKLEQAKQ